MRYKSAAKVDGSGFLRVTLY